MNRLRSVLLSALLLSGFFPAVGLGGEGASPIVRRVVVVSIDGLRLDALRPDWMPNLTRVADRGVVAEGARCVVPSRTIPNHISMVTGKFPAAHGFLTNEFEGRYAAGTLFEILAARNRTSGLYVSKMKLALLARPSQVGRYQMALKRDSKPAVEAFRSDMAAGERSRWNFCFIHLGDPDWAGHRHGWMSPQYGLAVQEADRLFGVIWEALEENGLLEKTLLILTADHGGGEKDHGADVPEVRRVPWIALGGGVRRGVLLSDPVGPQDIAPTVLYALGEPVPSDMQGRVIEGVFAPAEAVR